MLQQKSWAYIVTIFSTLLILSVVVSLSIRHHRKLRSTRGSLQVEHTPTSGARQFTLASHCASKVTLKSENTGSVSELDFLGKAHETQVDLEKQDYATATQESRDSAIIKFLRSAATSARASTEFLKEADDGEIDAANSEAASPIPTEEQLPYGEKSDVVSDCSVGSRTEKLGPTVAKSGHRSQARLVSSLAAPPPLVCSNVKKQVQRPTTHNYVAWLTNLPQPYWVPESNTMTLAGAGEKGGAQWNIKTQLTIAKLAYQEHRSSYDVREEKKEDCLEGGCILDLSHLSKSRTPLRIPVVNSGLEVAKVSDHEHKTEGFSSEGVAVRTSNTVLVSCKKSQVPLKLHPLSPRHPNHKKHSLANCSSMSVPRIVLSPPAADGRGGTAKPRELLVPRAGKPRQKKAIDLPTEFEVADLSAGLGQLDFNLQFDVCLEEPV